MKDINIKQEKARSKTKKQMSMLLIIVILCILFYFRFKVWNVIVRFMEMNVSDILGGITLIIAVLGGGFTLYQYYNDRKLKKAQYLEDIIMKVTTDPLYRVVFSLIDEEDAGEWYNDSFYEDEKNVLEYTKKYDPKSAGPETLEVKIDRFLSHISYICYMREKEILSKDEFSMLEYQVNATCTNKQVQNYLYNVYHYGKSIKADCSFIYLVRYGIEHELFVDGFENEEEYLKDTIYTDVLMKYINKSIHKNLN